MGKVISLPGEVHQQTQTLLPWYANGTLDEAEMAAVEAHLAECPECRADLALEHAISRTVVEMPLDVEQGWAAMRNRITQAQASDTLASSDLNVVPLRRRLLPKSIPLGWALLGQAAAATLIFGIGHQTVPVASSGRLYHTLSSAAHTAPGNIVVIFRPDTIERDLRDAVLTNGGEFVGGPSGSSAYILRVQPAQRQDALRRLHANIHVVMAEPIDADMGR